MMKLTCTTQEALLEVMMFHHTIFYYWGQVWGKSQQYSIEKRTVESKCDWHQLNNFKEISKKKVSDFAVEIKNESLNLTHVGQVNIKMMREKNKEVNYHVRWIQHTL